MWASQTRCKALDPNSVLKVTSMQMANNQSTVHWASVIGKTYHLESSLNLVTWTPGANTSVTATTTDTARTISLSTATRLFLRVAVGGYSSRLGTAYPGWRIDATSERSFSSAAK